MTNETIITIQHEKQQLLLKPMSLYVYQGFQVIEAFNTELSECYYLLFYKTSYLTGKCTTKIKRISRLSTILQKGIKLTPTHPLLSHLLTNNRVHTFPSLNPLWEKVQKKYSPLEAANILTIFDSYMKKDKIMKVIKEFALQFRREGQLLHTYQVLHLLVRFYPTFKWANEMAKQLQYQSYHSLYQSKITTLMTKDPLYVEQYCYEHLDDEKCLSILSKILIKEARITELLCLSTHALIHSTTNDKANYKQLLEHLPTDYTNSEKADFLSYIALHRTSQHDELSKDLLTLLKKQERYEEALLLLTKNGKPISIANFPYLLEIVVHMDLTTHVNIVESLNLPLSDGISPKQAQALFQVIVPILLKEKGLDYTHQWLETYYRQYPTAPILLKIKKMAAIKDDPDQMYALGEMYYQMKQLNDAVECFNWELELNPTNINSIKWLTKLYLEMGMIEESKSYQYMYHNLQKGS
ncbi:tetratricopeptide repeat protein [Sutcliffiella halmapala]|uniref:tetratricopeptide repeat protein n=1 Tax=Sutcliffiella halmapala TaxID=79882 RepID=UPI000994F052|nr:tetratricopeptide repeat protein [Sutcliffiella halmapala]